MSRTVDGGNAQPVQITGSDGGLLGTVTAQGLPTSTGQKTAANSTSVVQGNSTSSQTATIATGQSVQTTGILIPDGHTIVEIITDVAWTAAAITFTVCDTVSGTYWDVYTADGTEYTIPSSVIPTAAKRSFLVPPGDITGLAGYYLKLRSGTGAVPQAQGGPRSLTVVTKPV